MLRKTSRSAMGLAVAVVAMMAACARARRDTGPSASAAADTIALERSACYGTCPVYRVLILGDGQVHVTGDSARRANARRAVDPSAFAALEARATAIGFYRLPAKTRKDQTLCPLPATDHPTITIGIVKRGARTRVEDYTGCYLTADPLRRAPELLAFAALARAIDSVAGTRGPR